MATARATRSSNRIAATTNVASVSTSSKLRIASESSTVGTKSNTSAKRKTVAIAVAPPTTPPAKKQRRVINGSTSNKKVSLDSSDVAPGDLKNRPAEPHMTNAPLLTPHGSRIVTYTEQTADVSPSKSGIPKATTNTANLLEEACAHLIEVEPKFEQYIKAHHCHVFSPEGLAEDVDPFKSLASGIISQQVSGAAAASIKRKFIGLFNGETEGEESEWTFPAPEAVAKADVPFLRTAGLSERKAEYIKGLAEKFASGELTARWLIEAPYEEMVEKLVAVRGLGKWSVEMFACFSLKRMDVFSLGDLGIQRGVGVILGRDVKKLKAKGGKWKYATEKEMTEFAEKFSPYRSLLMWYLWKASDTAVTAIQD